MKVRALRSSLALPLAVLAFAGTADAQRRPAPPPREPSAPAVEESKDLKAHFGIDMAQRLSRSTDPEDRLRAIARAASSAKRDDAIAFLTPLAEPSSAVRSDGRAMLELVRALARFDDNEKVTRALLGIVSMQGGRVSGSRSDPSPEDPDNAARLEMARGSAALALARSRDPKAVEGLFAAARGGSAGQAAARSALVASPPAALPPAIASAAASPALLGALPDLGDLRTLEAMRGAAKASDPQTRATAVLALARMGDARVVELAKAGLTESDARVKASSAEALVLVDSPDRFKAVLALFEDEATTLAGIRLAERVSNDAIVGQLGARASKHPERAIRLAALRALSRSPELLAVRSLLTLAQDSTIRYEAIHAMARSPHPSAATAIEQLLTSPPGIPKGPEVDATRRLAARAYLVRAIVRGDRSSRADEAIHALYTGSDPTGREVATLCEVALGLATLEERLASSDARVRRAAVMGALALDPKKTRAALYPHVAKDPDARVRELATIALVGDPEGPLPITLPALADRAGAGGPDSGIAARIIAERADDAILERVWKLLGDKSPIVREHTARGLGRARAPQATGRLVAALAYEASPVVRRAVVAALAERPDLHVLFVRDALSNAATLDPDDTVRWLAARALTPSPLPAPPVWREAAWLRVTTDGAAPSAAYAGSLHRDDGLAVPIVFDGDGFAVVAVPPGEVRLALEPRVP